MAVGELRRAGHWITGMVWTGVGGLSQGDDENARQGRGARGKVMVD